MATQRVPFVTHGDIIFPFGQVVGASDLSAAVVAEGSARQCAVRVVDGRACGSDT